MDRPNLEKSGRFYPSGATTAEARLRYYSSQFPLVEVDSPYYGLPLQATSGLWVNRTPANFTFDIKSFRLFTKHPTPLMTIPRDIRSEFPEPLKQKKRIYYHNLPKEFITELWSRFEDALLPLDSAGKLGVVLFQFPNWFFPGNEQPDHILECQKMLPQYRIAVEFRHGSWLNEKNYERTMNFLRENNLTYVCVDEPQGLRTSVPPVAEATTEIGIVRFHGRNKANWEKPEQRLASSRFKYLYNKNDLGEWVPRVRKLASRTSKQHIVFNNCFEDQAVNGARDLAMMLN